MPEKSNKGKRPIPVILDTDIGDDIDDTWALGLLLKCPELDLKLVVTDTGDTAYRARIAAKMLQVAGRTDVPVGVGLPFDSRLRRPQAPWVEGYELAHYPGEVHDDGVGAIIDTIMSSPEPVTLICIGPVPNISAALEREPRIAERARFVGMHGSLRVGYGGSPKPSRECNVVNHLKDCQKVFTAAWDMTITPLDTCGLVSLSGPLYQRVLQCEDPVTRAIIENYRIWAQNIGMKHDWRTTSTTLFDTVAVYLAFDDSFLVMEDLGVRVTDEGYTVIDDQAKHMRCATRWKDLKGFRKWLTERLTGEV